MASTDARPLPLKNTAYRFTFAIRKPSDGTLITSWAGADSEVSKDGGSFSDCTNEATEIGTSGVGYLDLTSTEMNADTVALKITVTNTGAVPQVFTFLPEESSDRDVLIDGIWDEVLTGATHNVPTSAGIRLRQISSGIVTAGTAQGGSANSITLASAASSTNGTYDPAGVRLVGGTGAGQVRLILHYVGSTRVATVDRDWRTAPDSTSDYENHRGAELDVDQRRPGQGGSSKHDHARRRRLGGRRHLQGANLRDSDRPRSGPIAADRQLRRGHEGRDRRLAVGNRADQRVGIPDAADGPGDDGHRGTGSITDTSFATDAITAAALAASAVTEIQSGLATAANLATLTGYVDTEVAAIKAKTDALPSDPADESSIQATLATLATSANLATLTGYVDTEVAAIKLKTDLIPASPAAVSDIPSAASIADAVWDEAIAGHAAAGSTGDALSDASAGAGGGGASAADIADAVWDEALAGHATAGTGGKVLTEAATAAALATVAGYVDTEVAAIKAKTDNLPSDTADQSALTATMATLATAANLATLTGYVDTEVAAIKAKTDLLPASPASETTLGTLATAANLAVVDGVVDAILLDTAALDARVPAARRSKARSSPLRATSTRKSRQSRPRRMRSRHRRPPAETSPRRSASRTRSLDRANGIETGADAAAGLASDGGGDGRHAVGRRDDDRPHPQLRRYQGPHHGAGRHRGQPHRVSGSELADVSGPLFRAAVLRPAVLPAGGPHAGVLRRPDAAGARAGTAGLLARVGVVTSRGAGRGRPATAAGGGRGADRHGRRGRRGRPHASHEGEGP